MGSGWKSRKVVLTFIALVGITVGFVYGFIHGDGTVVLAALGALGLVTGVYNVANAYQAGKFAANGKAVKVVQDEP